MVLGRCWPSAYTVAFFTYQLGTLIVSLKNGNGFALGAGFVPGLIAVLAMALIIVAVGIYNNKKMAEKYALKK